MRSDNPIIDDLKMRLRPTLSEINKDFKSQRVRNFPYFLQMDFVLPRIAMILIAIVWFMPMLTRGPQLKDLVIIGILTATWLILRKFMLVQIRVPLGEYEVREHFEILYKFSSDSGGGIGRTPKGLPEIFSRKVNLVRLTTVIGNIKISPWTSYAFDTEVRARDFLEPLKTAGIALKHLRFTNLYWVDSSRNIKINQEARQDYWHTFYLY